MHFNINIPKPGDLDRVIYKFLLGRLTSPLYTSMIFSMILALFATFASTSSGYELTVNIVYAFFAIIPSIPLANTLIHIKRLMPFRNTKPFSNIIKNLELEDYERQILLAIYNVYLKAKNGEKEKISRDLIGILFDKMI